MTTHDPMDRCERPAGTPADFTPAPTGPRAAGPRGGFPRALPSPSPRAPRARTRP